MISAVGLDIFIAMLVLLSSAAANGPLVSPKLKYRPTTLTPAPVRKSWGGSEARENNSRLPDVFDRIELESFRRQRQQVILAGTTSAAEMYHPALIKQQHGMGIGHHGG